ncbi:UDP-3-O-(3-hydroxymyristoyl)glucosamine N-acyltransferase [Robiginitomaculum antarcticum]|uniref:UDP-3-O-(3-hydroxymyristoyl)glucosamine N-acyltransferase n=1 Tax=Robiginitomaculum antarcticum TaxID=437507 RepID=UPI00036716A0|nr:UDP-3-O-(3-hydroxymyristoyl)glucosamine N-acyltransferase [Robiginitomaculum antarcticum]
MVDKRYYDYQGSVRLSQIGQNTALQLSFNTDQTITDVVPLSVRRADAISYYAGKKYKSDLQAATGGIILCKPEDVEVVQEAGAIAVVTPFPRAAFAHCVSKLYCRRSFETGDVRISPSAKIAKTAKIMPGAVIGPDAVISENATIQPNAVIGPGVSIGAGSHIGAGVLVICAEIGKHCRINGGAVIGGDGFGVDRDATGNVEIDHIGYVKIHDYVSIGYNTTIDRGMLGTTEIGARSKIDNLCQIGHNTLIGEDCMFAAHTGISGSCEIGNRVAMGGGVGLADHITIGDNVILAAMAGVMKSVPADEVWSGFPAKPLRQHMREIAILSRMARPKKS